MGSLLLSEPTLASRFERKKKKKRRGGEERRRVKWKRKGKGEKREEKKEHTLARSRSRTGNAIFIPSKRILVRRFLDTRGIIKAKYLDPREGKIFEGMNN